MESSRKDSWYHFTLFLNSQVSTKKNWWQRDGKKIALMLIRCKTESSILPNLPNNHYQGILFSLELPEIPIQVQKKTKNSSENSKKTLKILSQLYLSHSGKIVCVLLLMKLRYRFSKERSTKAKKQSSWGKSWYILSFIVTGLWLTDWLFPFGW